MVIEVDTSITGSRVKAVLDFNTKKELL